MLGVLGVIDVLGVVGIGGASVLVDLKSKPHCYRRNLNSSFMTNTHNKTSSHSPQAYNTTHITHVVVAVVVVVVVSVVVATNAGVVAAVDEDSAVVGGLVDGVVDVVDVVDVVVGIVVFTCALDAFSQPQPTNTQVHT